MKKIALFICLLIALIGTNAFALKVGDKVYKEITINDKKANKWFEIYEFDKVTNLFHSKSWDGDEVWLDEKENILYQKDPDGFEKWYNEKGRIIHKKYLDGSEEWFDEYGRKTHIKFANGTEQWHDKFDSNGRVIYGRITGNIEFWVNYDESGYLAHSKLSTGKEEWFDEKGRRYHLKDSDGHEELVYEFDSKGNVIHFGVIGGPDFWQDFDPKGKPIHLISSDGNECWQEFDELGRKIHVKWSFGTEFWLDTFGRIIHKKLANGVEEWYDDFNLYKKAVHGKRSDGTEFWNDFDDKGRLIHKKFSDGSESWLDYNKYGWVTHQRWSYGKEVWLDFYGNTIHEKWDDGLEEWFEKGTVIHRKYSDGLEEWFDANGNKINKDTSLSGNSSANKQEPPKPIQSTFRDSALYFVFFSGSGDVKLSKLNRKVQVASSPLQAVMEVLLDGASPDEMNQGYLSLIPPGTKRNSIRVSNGIAIMDFSGEFMFNTFGPEGMKSQLKQIIYTASEFSEIKAVQFLIDGKIVPYMADTVYTEKPLTKNSL